MKYILFSLIIIFNLSFSNSEEFHSTLKGGYQHDLKTWPNNKVPGKNDNVFINSNVIVDDSIDCKNLTIVKIGSLSFINAKTKYYAKVNGLLDIQGGSMIISDSVVIEVKVMKRTPDAELHNNGILTIGD